jgi:hypothetical protein
MGALAPAQAARGEARAAESQLDHLVISAYRVGSYRGAAAVCQTTPKTVRRVIERHEAGGAGAERKPRERNYEEAPAVAAAVLAATRVSASSHLVAAGNRIAAPKGN